MRSLYIAGHTGLVGSAMVRHLSDRAGCRVITAASSQLDLRDSRAVQAFLERERPEGVMLAAGLVGGISANMRRPAEFLYDNLMIEANVIHASWKTGVQRLLNFGSGCVYPKDCPQPMRPEHLMAGKMEPTSEPYALAKLAGMRLCDAYNRQYGTRFVNAIPCTVYGPGDNFDLQEGHVLSALLRRVHEAKEAGKTTVTLWGTGNPRREFIYADDLAEACELLLDRYADAGPVNIGAGEICSIGQLAERCAEVVGYCGRIEWDRSRPDGAPEKRLDSSEIRSLGWMPKVGLKEGLQRTYRWFQKQRTDSGVLGSVR